MYYPNSSPSSGIKFVNGIQEVNNYWLVPGTQAIFMDRNKDRFYLKETDFNGFSVTTEYEFKKVEYPQENPSNYITKEEFELWKEKYESVIQQIESAANAATASIPQADKSATGKSSVGANDSIGSSLFTRAE